jgi:hypothetical protein
MFIYLFQILRTPNMSSRTPGWVPLEQTMWICVLYLIGHNIRNSFFSTFGFTNARDTWSQEYQHSAVGQQAALSHEKYFQ